MSTSPPLSSAAVPAACRQGQLRFVAMELSGSLGDLGTFLPLALGLSLSTGMPWAPILVLAGVMNIATGWRFGQPIPVQPMKALAAVAITQAMTRGQVAAAGVVMGITLTALALLGAAGWLAKRVPASVVHGLQLGLGATLALKSVELVAGWRVSVEGVAQVREVPWGGPGGLLVAGLAGAALTLPLARRLPMLIVVFAGGLGLAALNAAPAAPGAFRPLSPLWPRAGDWWPALCHGVLGQLPLTMLNSVVAVCALSEQLFPGRGARPRDITLSVGLMNLVSAPLGGMPMCHGSGGLAAQHRFGARTGLAPVLLGGLLLLAGLAFGSTTMGLLAAFPRPILGVMLLLPGITLAQAAGPSLRGRAAAVTLTAAMGTVAAGVTAGFLAGLALAAVLALAVHRGLIARQNRLAETPTESSP